MLVNRWFRSRTYRQWTNPEAFAYGLIKQIDEKILVFDLGGVRLINPWIRRRCLWCIVNSWWQSHSGGNNFDNKIIDHMVAESEKEHWLFKDKMALQRLKDASLKKRKKIYLMYQAITNQLTIYHTAGESGPLHLKHLHVQKFDELTADLVERTKVPVRHTKRCRSITNQKSTEAYFGCGSTGTSLQL